MTPITFYSTSDMPSSYAVNIAPIISAVVEHKPASVYDIGVGYGKYGMLLREYLDNYDHQLHLAGCEIFEEYLVKGPAQYIYNEIDVCDWLKAKPGRSHYALVLMIDVLEHFTVADGAIALRKALRFTDKILVSTPLGYEQGSVNGNKHEAHLSEWPMNKFKTEGFRVSNIASCHHSVVVWVLSCM